MICSTTDFISTTSLEVADLQGMGVLFWRCVAHKIASLYRNIALEKLKKNTPPPLLTFKQLIHSGDLGLDSYINHAVWTAGIRRKVYVSRPGAVLWSGATTSSTLVSQAIAPTLSSSSQTHALLDSITTCPASP